MPTARKGGGPHAAKSLISHFIVAGKRAKRLIGTRGRLSTSILFGGRKGEIRGSLGQSLTTPWKNYFSRR